MHAASLYFNKLITEEGKCRDTSNLGLDIFSRPSVASRLVTLERAEEFKEVLVDTHFMQIGAKVEAVMLPKALAT